MSTGTRRVLVVSRMFPHPDEPGSGPFVHEQVRALRQRGVDARVLCPRPFPFFLKRPFGIRARWRDWRHAWANLRWDDCDGVPVVYAPYHVGQVARLLRRRYPVHHAVAWAGVWILEQFPFDLVHAHTAFPDGDAAWSLALERLTPLVITEHTGPFSVLTDNAVSRAGTLRAIGRAHRVWCVSDTLTREVRGYFPPEQQAHITTLYNGVDTVRFRPPERWRPDPAAPRFVFVGFLVEIKNLPILLDAFAQVRRRLPGATLTLAGDGPLRGALEAQAGDGVAFLGALGREAVAELLRERCDILVLPSRVETFGMVLVEALASGKPVVATRCGGPESIVTEPALGALCAPNDADALADSLLATAGRLPTFDAAAIRAHAVERFDLGNLAAALCDQYEAILAEDSRRE